MQNIKSIASLFSDIISIGTSSNVVTISDNYIPVRKNIVILANDDVAGSIVTIILPAANISADRILMIKKLGNTANVVIDATNTEVIDGGLTATLETQDEAITLVCDGIKWYIF